MVVVFGTGHRPEDFDIEDEKLRELIAEAINSHPRPMEIAVCGMAPGFDLAWGLEAHNQGLDIWTARPWAGHKPRVEDRPRYEFLMDVADHNVVLDDSRAYPGPWIYQVRNQWMVNNSDEGIALWNGKETGGTWNCLRYAKCVGKEVTNIHP